MSFVDEDGLPATVAGSFVRLQLVAFVVAVIHERFAIRAQGLFASGLFTDVTSSAAAAHCACWWLILLVVVACSPASDGCNKCVHLLHHGVHVGFPSLPSVSRVVPGASKRVGLASRLLLLPPPFLAQGAWLP